MPKSPAPTPEGRWLYSESTWLCPEHGTPLRVRDMDTMERYCPLDEQPEKLSWPRQFKVRKTMMKAMKKHAFESATHEKEEGAAMKDWHAAEKKERAAKKTGDRTAWEKAEKKEHGALKALNKAEQREHGVKVAAMRDELEKIAVSPRFVAKATFGGLKSRRVPVRQAVEMARIAERHHAMTKRILHAGKDEFTGAAAKVYRQTTRRIGNSVPRFIALQFPKVKEASVEKDSFGPLVTMGLGYGLKALAKNAPKVMAGSRAFAKGTSLRGAGNFMAKNKKMIGHAGTGLATVGGLGIGLGGSRPQGQAQSAY